jgi:hypothetical protein
MVRRNASSRLHVSWKTPEFGITLKRLKNWDKSVPVWKKL